MRNLILAVIPLLFLELAHGIEPVRLSFEDLPKFVASRNKHVSGAQAFLGAAHEQTGHLTRSYLPRITVLGGGETFRTGPYDAMTQPYGGIDASVNLFRGGRDSLEESARGGQVQVSQAEYQKISVDELTEARKAFWSIVFQREVLKVMEDARERNQRNLAAALKRISAGIGTKADRLEFEMSRVFLDQDLTRLKLGIRNSQRELSILMGLPSETPLETIAIIPHDHQDTLLGASLEPEAHRDVVALRASYAVSEARTTQAYRWWTPSVDLYGGYNLYTLRNREYLPAADRDELVAGFRLTLELFDGLQSVASAKAASLQAQGYSDRADQTAAELRGRFESIKQELRMMHELVHDAERSVVQGAEYLALTSSEYSRGIKNSPDVLGATLKFVEFKRRAAEVRRDYQLAKAELLSILGR